MYIADSCGLRAWGGGEGPKRVELGRGRVALLLLLLLSLLGVVESVGVV